MLKSSAHFTTIFERARYSYESRNMVRIIFSKALFDCEHKKMVSDAYISCKFWFGQRDSYTDAKYLLLFVGVHVLHNKNVSCVFLCLFDSFLDCLWLTTSLVIIQDGSTSLTAVHYIHNCVWIDN